METPQLQFEIITPDPIDIADFEISELLTQVYVAGGFTKPDEAVALFEPSEVRRRGMLICAREMQLSELAGMVIVVPPDSPFRRLAGENEAELHLLAVKSEYRRLGVGRKLVEAAVSSATRSGYSKLILWTQLSMNAAQKLYASANFLHIGNMERNGRDFKVYERTICN